MPIAEQRLVEPGRSSGRSGRWLDLTPPNARSSKTGLVVTVLFALLAAPREIAANLFTALATLSDELTQRWQYSVGLALLLVLIALTDD